MGRFRPAPGDCAAAAMYGWDALPAIRERGSLRRLANTGAFTVSEVHCEDDRRGLTGPRIEVSWCLVLVRRGGFLRAANGQEDFFDASSGYVARPGDETLMGHPAGPGDVSTAIVMAADLVDELSLGVLPVSRILTSAEFDLQHRYMVAACRRGADDLEVDERLHALFAMLSARNRTEPPSRPSTAVAHRRLVAAACEAFTEGEFTLGLGDLARRLHCSPHHLSRVFRRVTGRTITAHRNELRVRAMLEDVQQGHTRLRALAARYGFADQAHMGRVVRRHLGRTPAALAQMLAFEQ